MLESVNLTPNTCISVVGLGYVGLPLAIAFGKKFRTIGYDVSEEKIANFKKQLDPTNEVSPLDFEDASHLTFTSNSGEIAEAQFIIVAVPTPIDAARQPDLSPLIGASKTVGRYMKKGTVVIFESTVYPGVTEDVCVPILEETSGLVWKTDFHVGYFPERINPGDREHTLERIIKVVAGDDAQSLDKIGRLYASVVDAGVHRASCIKEAEAAKVIENTQRDLNIALMNELAIIFDKLSIDTRNVLKAAGTKWNFLPFTPGLVGGHCIGVDPYYLTHKAEKMGYHPQVILAGRRINDNMGEFIAEKTVKLMIQAGRMAKGAKVGLLGLTFKEDCPDLRNSRVVDIIRELESYGIYVHAHDPLADPDEARAFYGVALKPWADLQGMDALIIAVGHGAYREMKLDDFTGKLVSGGCIIDVKGILNPEDVRENGCHFWRL
jgi:UDP-N-acetyl-D-glucosamine/UDP-N-acetyl-D-galactosamine dehydrogenase